MAAYEAQRTGEDSNLRAYVARSLGQVAALHRDPRWHATLCSILSSGEFKNVGGLSREQLLEPPFSKEQAKELQADVYVTINGMEPARGRSRTPQFKTLLAGRRKEKDIRALNAVWVDIDTYKRDLAPEHVVGLLRNLQTEDGWPPWSLEIHSGRGVWLLWFLRSDDDLELPPEASNVNKELCHGINRALAEKFSHLGGDARSVDLARITRVPGTVNSAAQPGTVVRWEFAESSPTYTLTQLHAAFCKPDEPASPTRRRRGSKPDKTSRTLSDIGAYRTRRGPRITRFLPGKDQASRRIRDIGTYQGRRAPRGRGFSAVQAANAADRRWGLPLIDLLALAYYRNGFEKGFRHYALFWLAHLLKRCLPDEPGKASEIRRICREVNAEFRPPLSRNELDRQVDKALNWEAAGHVRNASLSKLFEVTKAEARLLRVFKPADQAPPAEWRALRREAVIGCYNDWLEAKGTPPKVRELMSELSLAGFTASHSTIRSDLAEARREGRLDAVADGLLVSSQWLTGT